MGRHTAPKARRRSTRPARRLGTGATAALAAAVTAAVAVPLTLLWPDGPAISAVAGDGANCRERPDVAIAVAPQIAPVVQAAARRATAAGACANYSVQAAAPQRSPRPSQGGGP